MTDLPTINFIGNKQKISSWISSHFGANIDSIFDAFSGGCSISYKAKKMGLRVLSNDILKMNFHIAKGIIENSSTLLQAADVKKIFSGEPVEGFIYKNFSNVYYFPDECMQLDNYRKNIDLISNEYKKSLALILLRRAMIRKRPYSRFNIKWEKVIQLRDEDFSYRNYKRKRAYHNESFKKHFMSELDSYNKSIFDNKCINKAYNKDIFDIIDKVDADLIYLDPPYPGTMNDYYSFYGFLDEFVSSKKLNNFKNNFTDKGTVVDAFDELFSKLKNFKFLLMSLNSKSFPSKDIMTKLLKKHFKEIELVRKKHNYQITGSKNKTTNEEYLFKGIV